MQHDQGFTRSHWTPPSGDYSLRIAQAAARVTIISMIMKHIPTLLAISMAIAMRRYYTKRIARWRRFVAFIKATKRHHRTSTCSDITQSDTTTPVVSDISS
jgi:Na+/melibiose symporter-like transporter